MEEGNPQEALRRLVHGFGVDAGHKPLYRLAASCLRQAGGEEEAQLFDTTCALHSTNWVVRMHA